MDAAPWKFYLIQNGNRTYAGVSPDPTRRLRQHNGEICGGAKYTRKSGPGWIHKCIVEGFTCKRDALQFEWAVKHCAPRKTGGLEARLQKLVKILCKDKWTMTATPASTIPLTVVLHGCTLKDATDLPDYVTLHHAIQSSDVQASSPNKICTGIYASNNKEETIQRAQEKENEETPCEN